MIRLKCSLNTIKQRVNVILTGCITRCLRAVAEFCIGASIFEFGFLFLRQRNICAVNEGGEFIKLMLYIINNRDDFADA